MAPTTRSDRLTGGLVGGIAGLWIGGLGRIIFGQLPVSFEVVVAWALCAACLGFALGIRFPKIMTGRIQDPSATPLGLMNEGGVLG